jgi:hypothetical protein
MMPAYWLKPLGVTDPPSPMPNDWTSGVDLSVFQLRTGPATHRKPPQMGPHDRVLFHAVTHVRLFAEAEIVGPPSWKKDPIWGLRWPWVYPCRVNTWVSLIEEGLRTPEIAPKKALGRIQLGGDFAQLSEDEYQAIHLALQGLPNSHSRK